MATGLDCKVYKGAAGAGGRITLARPTSVLGLSALGTAIFFVFPNAKGSKLPAIPVATPDPANNTTADGWIRVDAAGSPPNGGSNSIPLPPGQEITSLDVWCEAAGYLNVLASEAQPIVSRSV
jgi:hypothetical protein